jgi:hypothetical protein
MAFHQEITHSHFSSIESNAPQSDEEHLNDEEYIFLLQQHDFEMKALLDLHQLQIDDLLNNSSVILIV